MVRTITLTGRRPVRISPENWPIIARADEDSFGGADHAKRDQALHRGECDVYRIIVRKHADGRVIVYAILNAAIAQWRAPAGGIDARAGYMLAAGAGDGAIIQAIKHVSAECDLPQHMAGICIASLAPEDII